MSVDLGWLCNLISSEVGAERNCKEAL